MDYQIILGSTFAVFEQLKGKARRAVMPTWRPPPDIRSMSQQQSSQARNRLGFQISGENLPVPIFSFTQMRLPKAVRNALKSLQIIKPSNLQAMCLPTILQGRDAIVVTPLDLQKWLCFILPGIILGLQQEKKLPLSGGEGPMALVIAPSHELAIQLHEYADKLNKQLHNNGYPLLRLALCIGGVNIKQQAAVLRHGVHMIVATPGRLSHLLDSRRDEFSLQQCRYLVLDQTERLLDLTFQNQIRGIMNRLDPAHQIVCFSSQMGQPKLLKLAECLSKPVVVRFAFEELASLKVLHEIDYIKEEDKIVYLLYLLEKTQPQAAIFCENKLDCDEVNKFLLSRGVRSVCLHGGKSHKERQEAISQFKAGRKDVLVATQIAARGISFGSVSHVINYDIPKEIETYLQRTVRLGTRGSLARVSSMVNKSQEVEQLAKLKALLEKCRQPIPSFMQQIQ